MQWNSPPPQPLPPPTQSKVSICVVCVRHNREGGSKACPMEASRKSKFVGGLMRTRSDGQASSVHTRARRHPYRHFFCSFQLRCGEILSLTVVTTCPSLVHSRVRPHTRGPCLPLCRRPMRPLDIARFPLRSPLCRNTPDCPISRPGAAGLEDGKFHTET